MKKRILNESALEKIKNIHELSQKKNAQNHTKKLLSMMTHHIDEIKELIVEDNPHAVIETGDLIILCMELILQQNGCIDSTLSKCFKRFEDKLV